MEISISTSAIDRVTVYPLPKETDVRPSKIKTIKLPTKEKIALTDRLKLVNDSKMENA